MDQKSQTEGKSVRTHYVCYQPFPVQMLGESFAQVFNFTGTTFDVWEANDDVNVVTLFLPSSVAEKFP